MPYFTASGVFPLTTGNSGTGQRRRIFRDNFHLESDDLTIDFPFQGQPSKSCGHMKKPRKHENAEFHPDHTVARTRTIKCHDPDCPQCNILWLDRKKRIPYLFGKRLVPDGWWGYSVESVEKRIEFFQGMINDELEDIRNGSGIRHNFKDSVSNEQINRIIIDYFPKSIPHCPEKSPCSRPNYCSYHKLHNILWHMLKTGESLRVYHVVLSPPQDQNYVSQTAFLKLKAAASRLFIKSGGWGGVIAMHHARVPDRFNDPDSLDFKGMEREDSEEGFHFHALGFGFFDYDLWKGSGWIVKNLSYNSEDHRCYSVHNIKGAMEYILEHCSVVSRKVSSGSLSCQKAFLTASTLDHTTNSISYSFDGLPESDPIDSETSEIEPPQSPIDSGVSETAKKLRKYDAYWYVGCLAKKNFKVPKKRPICPLGEHEIEKGSEKPFDIYVVEEDTAGPEYVSTLEFYKTLEMGDAESVESEIRLAKLGKLKIWIERLIDPLDFEKYFQRIYTKSDGIIHMVDWKIENGDDIPGWLQEIYEACKRRRLSDPNYKWFALSHSSYVSDVMNANAYTDAKFRMETTWKWT